jgi:hypothetical protein
MFKTIILSTILITLTASITYIAVPRPYMVHHHANFAVYMDGKQWDFSGPSYMEEVSRCNITDWVTPQDRIHLHDGQWELVHVHMAASTWGDLFANLYIGLGQNYLSDGYGEIFQTGSGKNLYYVLNGKPVDNPRNLIVESEDRLLVWYGTGTVDEVAEKFDTLVVKTAHEYNGKADPASCSSNVYGPFGTIIDWIKELLPHKH